MQFEDLKFSVGIPNVSRPTLYAVNVYTTDLKREPYLCVVHPDRTVVGADGFEYEQATKHVYAPIGDGPLPRVEQSQLIAGRRYELVLNGFGYIRAWDGSAWWRGDSIEELSAPDEIYGPLPDRELIGKKACIVRDPAGLLWDGYCDGNKIVSVTRGPSKLGTAAFRGWKIVHKDD